MGAYLFQEKNGKEIPIAFMSKAFDERMAKWCTFQQEGFAIFYAMKKWRHLLLDRRFTLMTDHANLMYLKSTSDPKVLRWMVSIQEYDFEVEHIKGVDNKVADAFSRLCGLRRDVKHGPKESILEKKRKAEPIIHVVGERQSARLREKRVKTSPSPMTDVINPEVTAHVPTNTVDDTFNTVIDGPDPTFYHVIGEGKEIHSTTEGNSDRLVKRFFDELDNSRSEDTRKDSVIMLVEPRSLRLSQDERETETIPGRLSEEIEEPSSVVSTVEGSSEQLTLSGPPDPPRVSSKSEVNSQVILSCEKSCDVPGQCGSNRIKPNLKSKVRGILNINWDEKISKWFRIVHVHNVGHTGLERTTSKLFEIPEVQRYSLQGYLPKDLKSRIGEMIKSCNTCQKNTSMKPTAQASHFSCSVYKKIKRIAIDYIEALRPECYDSRNNRLFLEIHYPIPSQKQGHRGIPISLHTLDMYWYRRP